jgi:hypothetical protein
MEERIRARIMHLDNLLRQYLNIKTFYKSKKDDVAILEADLKKQLRHTYTEILSELDIKFEKKNRENEISEQYLNVNIVDLVEDSPLKANYKIMKILQSFNFIRNQILHEIPSIQPQVLNHDEDDDMYLNIHEDNQIVEQQLMEKEKEEIKQPILPDIIKVYDYDLEEKLEENKTLEACTRVLGEVETIQNDISQHLALQKDTLMQAQKETYNAAKTSKEALDITKKNTKRKWTFFPWKLGIFSAIGGAVVGGVSASVPGAVIGGVGGGIGGATIGHKIKKGVGKDINNVKGENPESLDRTDLDDPQPVKIIKVCAKRSLTPT